MPLGKTPSKILLLGLFAFLLIVFSKYYLLNTMAQSDSTSDANLSFLPAGQSFLVFGALFLLACTVGYFHVRKKQTSMSVQISVYVHVIATTLSLLAMAIQSVYVDLVVLDWMAAGDGLFYIDHSTFISSCILLFLGAQLILAMTIFAAKPSPVRK